MSSRARIARDKWAAKKWFRVLASSTFGFAELGLVPANDEAPLIGRTFTTSFYNITKDPAQLPIKLKFQIVKVIGDTAYTQFKGYELTRDYIRTLVRRGRSRVDAIRDVVTKDGIELRVMAMAITTRRVKTSQERAIRKIMFEIIDEKAEQLDFESFIQESVLGQIAGEIMVRAKKIYPLHKAEIRKIKVLTPVTEIPLKLPEQAAQQTAAPA